MTNSDKLNWYPIRVFFGRAEMIKKALDEGDIEYFYPMRMAEKVTSSGLKFIEEPLVKSLLFIKTDREELRLLKLKFGGILNHQNAFPFGNERTERIQHRRLA